MATMVRGNTSREIDFKRLALIKNRMGTSLRIYIIALVEFRMEPWSG